VTPRRSLAIPATVAACAAIILVPSLPAYAVVDTQTWVNGSDAFWSTTTAWTTGEAPEAGDTLVFSAPTASARSTKNGAYSVAGINFVRSHEVANGGGDLGIGTGGLTTAPDSVVSIDANIQTTGAQLWSIGTGSTATFPGVIRTDGASTLTLDVDGTMEVNGNLDAQATGSVVKTGIGTIVRRGGAGGGIGNGGLSVQEGTFFLDGADIGGTAFTVAGGSLTGTGTANSLNMTSGTISPGTSDGSGVADLVAWGPTAWSGGRYSVTINATDSDSFLADNQTLALSGTELVIVAEAVPAAGTTFLVASADAGLTGQFTAGGVALAEGAEFASNGSRYSVSYAAQPNSVVVTYLGAVPVVTNPAAPLPVPVPELAATAAPIPGLLAGAAALLLGAGSVLLVTRRRTRVL